MGRAITDALSRFPKWIAKRNWDGLESTFHNQAREWSGRSLARQIGEVDLKRYRASLARGLAEALKAAEDHQAKAVYCEYDMVNGWSSRFYICKSYAPESAGNDEWTSEWAVEIFKEENYFFRLSRFTDQIVTWINSAPDVITPGEGTPSDSARARNRPR